jgi:membrane fusion protein (multidrug efflux system)
MKIFVGIALCVLIVVLGFGIMMSTALFKPAEVTVAETTPATKATNVHVQALKESTVQDLVILTGVLVPWKEVTLSAEASGSIESMNVDDGDPVEAGQKLIKIDTTAMRTVYNQAAARAKLAEMELERIQNLRKNDISSPQDLDRARTDRDIAQADIRAAQIQLDKSIVTAPLSGIADEVFKEQEEYVDIGNPLLRIMEVDRLKGLIGIPERDMLHFHAGDEVRIAPDALQGETRTGVIHRIGSSANMTTRTFLAEIEVDNTDRQLKPGMTIRAHLVRSEFQNAIEIPIFAVLSLENQRFAVIEEEGIARLRFIEVGNVQGGMVHVMKGLSAGDRLITSGHRELRDGDPVKIQERVKSS